MIYSYCKHCKTESPGDTCQLCGKKATAAAQRNIWSAAFLPISDGRTWKSILMALLTVMALCLAVFFIVEACISGNDSVKSMWQGNLPALIFAILPIGLLCAFLVLFLQGKETLVYVLDPKGAHLQTWHEPSLKKSWARMQSADTGRDVQNPSGAMMHFSQERHMIWADVRSVRYKPSSGQILLYHTPHCAPMVLRLTNAEYETAAAYVGKYCKGK